MKSNLGTIMIVAVLVAILGIGGYLMYEQPRSDSDLTPSDQVVSPTSEDVSPPINQLDQTAPSTTNNDSQITFGDASPAPEPIPLPIPKPKPSQTAEAGLNAGPTQTVTYTDSGFSPKTLNITVGTQVVFKNESSQPMWVAAAPYPTHSSNPGFDQKRAFGTGGSYTYTFNSAGGFNYQNDSNPSMTGRIIVQ